MNIEKFLQKHGITDVNEIEKVKTAFQEYKKTKEWMRQIFRKIFIFLGFLFLAFIILEIFRVFYLDTLSVIVIILLFVWLILYFTVFARPYFLLFEPIYRLLWIHNFSLQTYEINYHLKHDKLPNYQLEESRLLVGSLSDVSFENFTNSFYQKTNDFFIIGACLHTTKIPFFVNTRRYKENHYYTNFWKINFEKQNNFSEVLELSPRSYKILWMIPLFFLVSVFFQNLHANIWEILFIWIFLSPIFGIIGILIYIAFSQIKYQQEIKKNNSSMLPSGIVYNFLKNDHIKTYNTETFLRIYTPFLEQAIHNFYKNIPVKPHIRLDKQGVSLFLDAKRIKNPVYEYVILKRFLILAKDLKMFFNK